MLSLQQLPNTALPGRRWLLSAPLGLLVALTLCSALVSGCATHTVYVARDGGVSDHSDAGNGWRTVMSGATVDVLPGTAIGGTSSADLSGLVLVNIWASYCGPCVKEMPLLEEASQEGVVRVIGCRGTATPGSRGPRSVTPE